MRERSMYKNRVDAVKLSLVSEGGINHVCIRAVSAGFLDRLLPNVNNERVYQANEYTAGLRWFTLLRPEKSTPEALEKLLAQSRLPIEGFIVYAKTKKDSLPHAFAYMTDADRASSGDQFSIDTFISQKQWYITYPSVHDALRVMGLVYEKPYSVRAVWNQDSPIPAPDKVSAMWGSTGLCEWNIGPLSLAMRTIISKS